MGNICERRSPRLVGPNGEELPAPDPQKALEHRRCGNEHFKRKDFGRAVSEYSQAIKFSPQDAVLWVNRSTALRQLHLWSEAEEDAKRAVVLDPKNEKAYYGQGLALKHQGKIDEALRVVEAGLKVAPENKPLMELTEALKAEPPKPLAKAEPKPQPKPDPPKKKQESPKAPPKKKDYSIDYSKWKDFVDSDDEIGPPQVDPDDAALEEVGAESGLSQNPTFEERAYVIDQMMEMIRNARSKAQEEMKAEAGIGNKLGEQFLPSAPKIVSTELPDDYRKHVGVINLETLAKFSASKPRMLVSVYGDIFDVSNRPEAYKDGSKKQFSGKDATWALITGHEDNAHFNKFYDIFKLDKDKLERFLRVACHWMVSYREDHGQPVGRLDRWDAEREWPAPPTEDVKDPCPTQ